MLLGADNTTLLNAANETTTINNSAATTGKTISNVSNIYVVGGVVIGSVSIAVNGVSLFLLYLQRKKNPSLCNTLILNQSAILFWTSITLAMTYAVKFYKPMVVGGWGQVYCKTIGSDQLVRAGTHGSSTCLNVITIERYFKIVHSIYYRTRYRQWIQYVAVIFPWIYGFLASSPFLIVSYQLQDGDCLEMFAWSAKGLTRVISFATIIWKFLLPLIVFIVCYSKILKLMKTQFKANQAQPFDRPSFVSKSERNLIRALMFTVMWFVVCYGPFYIYSVYALAGAECCYVGSAAYDILRWLNYLNICVNPLVFTVKSDVIHFLIRRVNGGIQTNRRSRTVVVPLSDEPANRWM